MAEADKRDPVETAFPVQRRCMRWRRSLRLVQLARRCTGGQRKSNLPVASDKLVTYCR